MKDEENRKCNWHIFWLIGCSYSLHLQFHTMLLSLCHVTVLASKRGANVTVRKYIAQLWNTRSNKIKHPFKLYLKTFITFTFSYTKHTCSSRTVWYSAIVQRNGDPCEHMWWRKPISCACESLVGWYQSVVTESSCLPLSCQ
jgi:hypothetical protein